ncbi:MAG: ABC transporter ATP-binding protein [Acidimicrobiales bacterium]
MPAIEVDDLRVRYGDRTAVDGISFAVEPGEVLALLGPNGAGKTTTVETLEGYRSPTSGSVRVLGCDPILEHRQLVSSIGVVLQRGGVYPVMSPHRVLKLFASYYEDPRSATELLDLLGLDEVAATPFKRLSGGEQQRLALALALVGRPRVCFLDEPTAGVDPAGRIAVRDVIASIRGEGVAVLLTSHELDEVERLADRVVIIDHGHVLAAGAPGEVGGGEEEVRFSVEGEVDVAKLGAALAMEVISEGRGLYRLSGSPTPALVAQLTAFLAERDLALGDLRIGRERLEDVFLRLIKSEPEK